jgi:hypothetical protein
MKDASPAGTIIRRFEVLTVVTVELLLVAAVFAATVLLYAMFIHGVRVTLTTIESVAVLEERLGQVFAGVQRG